jgi:ATP-dependent DNA ligase
MPSGVKVALAALAKDAFSDPNWLFEIRGDRERALGYIRKGEAAELRSRSGRGITHQFPELRLLPKQLKALEAIVDGEIVVLDENGQSVNNRAAGVAGDLLYLRHFVLRWV